MLTLLFAAIGGVVSYFLAEWILNALMGSVAAAAVSGAIAQIIVSVGTGIAILAAGLLVLLSRAAGVALIPCVLLLCPASVYLLLSAGGSPVGSLLAGVSNGLFLSIYLGTLVGIAFPSSTHRLGKHEQDEPPARINDHVPWVTIGIMSGAVLTLAAVLLTFLGAVVCTFIAVLLVMKWGWLPAFLAACVMAFVLTLLAALAGRLQPDTPSVTP